jgi:hypothetical protein
MEHSTADGGFSCTISSLKQKVRVDHQRPRFTGLDPQRSSHFSELRNLELNHLGYGVCGSFPQKRAPGVRVDPITFS